MTMPPETGSNTSDALQRIVAGTVYRPLERGDVVAETVARLGRAIGMGLLRPGDRLPSEARLARALGISQVSLRSALTMLRGAGLVETRRGRGGGTHITADAWRADPLETPSLPPEAELRDLVDYRCVIEGGTAALAAERATDAQVQHLEELVAAMADVTSFPTWSERDTLLHLVVADASRSPRLLEEVGRLRAEVFRISTLVPVPRGAVELAQREHRALVSAIRARRPEAARRAMTRHVASTHALWLGLGRVPSA
ncbi:MAG: FadR/GntR family transcriptional regulator [Gaiella sp.]